MATQTPGGVTTDPRWLAAGAAGIVSAILALSAFRGLPFGPVMLWVTPLPLFLAGLAFGLPAMLAAVAMASLTLVLLGGSIPLAIHAAAFAIPALLVVATGLRRGGMDASVPLVLLGIYPALCILVAEALLAGSGGLEAILTAVVRTGLDRMGVAGDDTLIADIVRVKAAAVGFWLSVAMLVNGVLAQRFLAKRGLALLPSPDWSATRMPFLYPLLPALAAVAALLDGFEATSLSLLVILLLPVLLRGLALVHARSRGRRGRGLLLGAVYATLTIFSLPASFLLLGLALFDHFAARPARGTT